MLYKKLLLSIAFFVILPILAIVISSIFFIKKYPHTKNIPANKLASTFTAYGTVVNFAASFAEIGNHFSQQISSGDARVEILRKFFAQYNSPLEEHSALIVKLADEYKLDFRLIPAIAMQESNVCKRIPPGSHNCWGYGIYGDTVTKFKDYPEGIVTVSKALATKYRNKGLETPEEIMRMYTPSSNGSWANGVNTFIERME